MKKSFVSLSLILTIGFVMNACNLDEELQDSVTGQTSVSGGSADLGPLYSSLSAAFQSQENAYALQTHTSDELIGPTRGVDWSDFGVWRSLHQQTYDGSHPQVLNTWNVLNQGVVRANAALNAFKSGGNAVGQAQSRFMRAYFIWWLVDFFGQVPFRDENNTDFLNPPQVLDRKAATTYVISELEAILNTLPVRSAGTYNVPNREAAWAVLAKVYLNKFIYDGAATAPAADMDKVIQYADLIINSGKFSLAPGDQYFTANFGLTNQNSPESIFVIENRTGDNLGSVFGSRVHMTLHYNQNPSGWNGFTTIAEFYDKFNPVDKRFSGTPTAGMTANSGLRFGFLAGQQLDKNGQALKERGGAPLIFTKDIPITGATEARGIRVIKYEPDYANTATPGVDYPLIRFADIWLCKVEANFRKGQTAAALTDLNVLRTNRGVPARASIAANGQEILDERGFELYWEGHRRTDLIRFNKFNDAWTGKAVTPETTKLFPIPQAAVDTNPSLKQNPGY